MNKVVLSSIIEIISGGTPKTSVKEYWENGQVGWLSVTDFNNDSRFVYTTDKKITELGARESNTKYLEKGDIIISARGTVGALAQIGVPMCFNQSCFGIRGKKGTVDTDFLYYALKNYVKNIVLRSQGSVFNTINLMSFDLMEIQIPSQIEAQQNIAVVLSFFDSKISLNNRINAELEALAKTIYDYWFVQFDFPISAELAAQMGDASLQGKPYKSSGGKMVWNEEIRREVPEGWEVGSLLDIARFTNGLACQKFRPVDENRLPVIKIKEMRDGISANSEFVRADIPDKLVVQNGDVLFSWSASLEVQLWTGGTGGLNQHIFKVTSKEYPKSFYYFQLKHYLNYFKRVADLRKTTMGHITRDHLKQSRIAIPPKAEVVKLDQILSPLLERMIATQVENQELASLRDWLLPMLMNGQVKVGQVKEYVQEGAVGMAAEEHN